MISQLQKEKLRQFFAAYFHEDWSAEGATPEQVVSAFVQQRGAGPELRDLGQSIAAFVDEHPQESELDDALFKELGCYYSPHAEGISTKAWLLGIAARFAATGDA